MTSYQDTIMDLLQGDTPKAKHDFLVSLILDRDKFAMEINEFIMTNFHLIGKHEPSDTVYYIRKSSRFDDKRYLFNDVLDLFKQSHSKEKQG